MRNLIFITFIIGNPLLPLLSPAPLKGEEAPRTWALIPIALVNPENGYGFGAKYLNKAWPDKGNSIDVYGYGTTKKQAKLGVEQRHWNWFASGWDTRTNVEAFYYPESFFGEGNHPQDADEQIYTPKGAALDQEFAHALGGGWFLKTNAHAGWQKMGTPKAADGSPADANIMGPDLPGYSGGFDDAWGAGAEFDTRDDDNLPSRGWHAGHWISHSLLGEFSHGAVETWLAGYAAPRPDWEFASKVFQRTVTGHPPFYAEPYLGDKRMLRGITDKRLRDRSAQAWQAEARYQFDLTLPFIARAFGNRWQIAAFGGAGRVGSDFAAASRETLHWSGGMGGRLIIGKRLGAIRGDLGFSEYGTAFYIDFNQAF